MGLLKLLALGAWFFCARLQAPWALSIVRAARLQRPAGGQRDLSISVSGQVPTKHAVSTH